MGLIWPSTRINIQKLAKGELDKGPREVAVELVNGLTGGP